MTENNNNQNNPPQSEQPLHTENNITAFNKTTTLPDLKNDLTLSPRSNVLNNTEKINRVAKSTDMRFYYLGQADEKEPKKAKLTFRPNNAFRSTSNDLMDRNKYSINTRYYINLSKNKEYSVIKQQNIFDNNYLKPLNVYYSYNKYNIPGNCINRATYNLAKEKSFARDQYSTIKTGKNITKKEFLEEKKNLLNKKYYIDTNIEDSTNQKLPKNENTKKDENSKIVCNTMSNFTFKDPHNYSIEKLRSNKLNFDRNNQQFLQVRNWWKIDNNPFPTKISKEAPKWFQSVPEWKIKQFNDYLEKNEDTIHILSKHQNWITVTPKHKDRTKPLEKMKAINLEATSKIMPKWMEIKPKQENRVENLKSVNYYPIRQKAKGLMVLVDKELNPSKIKREIEYNPTRSIFSYGDFRNNVLTKEQVDFYNSKVSQVPKKFFDWDDGKKFDPKYKKDV